MTAAAPGPDSGEPPLADRHPATGHFLPGNSSSPGRKGAPNKVGQTMRKILLRATELAGTRLAAQRGVTCKSEEAAIEYLAHAAIEEPKAFLALWGRALPVERETTEGDASAATSWLALVSRATALERDGSVVAALAGVAGRGQPPVLPPPPSSDDSLPDEGSPP